MTAELRSGDVPDVRAKGNMPRTITLAAGLIAYQAPHVARLLTRRNRAGGHDVAMLMAWLEPTFEGKVLMSRDVTPAWGPLLHVSVSFPHRMPTWDELRNVKDAVFGDAVDAMMLLPRKQDYVNIHEHCLHIVETPQIWGLT